MTNSARVDFMADAPLSGKRRQFVKTCVTSAVVIAANPSMLAAAGPTKHYSRSLLVDQNGEAVNSASIKFNEAFIFHYPYVTTPCFLLNLGQKISGGNQLQSAENGDYTWQGGVGEQQSIVAFSAICAHKLSYPTRTVSFLNYRPEETSFFNEDETVEQRSHIIYCCSERSAYNPASGAEVLGGPANQPLTAIEIEYDDAADRFYAIGTRGGELYDTFFERFGFRLALDHKIDNVRADVSETTMVYPHSEYSQRTAAC